MSNPTYDVTRLAPGHDLEVFECSQATYNNWLTRHASASVQAGYLLLEVSDGDERVVGY